MCFYVEPEKFYQKSEVDVLFPSQLVKTGSHRNFVVFSRIQKHFHCHFLAAVDVAVGVAVE